MATNSDYIDSLIHNAGYLRDLVENDRVPAGFDEDFNSMLADVDNMLDSLCDMVNDEIGREQ